MTKLLIAYGCTFAFMATIDLLWLGVVAKTMYKSGIGHLMADQPVLIYGVLFYLIFPVGLMIFAVVPSADTVGWTKAFTLGALFGFFAYATYDLTNLTTLKDWPLWLSLIDMAWGSVVCGSAAVVGKIALERASAL